MAGDAPAVDVALVGRVARADGLDDAAECGERRAIVAPDDRFGGGVERGAFVGTENEAVDVDARAARVAFGGRLTGAREVEDETVREDGVGARAVVENGIAIRDAATEAEGAAEGVAAPGPVLRWHDARTARMEATPGGWVVGVGDGGRDVGVSAFGRWVVRRGGVAERGRVGVTRVVEDGRGGTALDDAPAVEDADAVARGADEPVVVTHEDVREVVPLSEVGEETEDGGSRGRVEHRDRLVEDDDVGIWRERASERDALALAAGERGRADVDVVGGRCETASARTRCTRSRRASASETRSYRGSATVAPTATLGFRLS
nr:hypothetical protein [Halarchaeum acidiphilum]